MNLCFLDQLKRKCLTDSFTKLHQILCDVSKQGNDSKKISDNHLKLIHYLFEAYKIGRDKLKNEIPQLHDIVYKFTLKNNHHEDAIFITNDSLNTYSFVKSLDGEFIKSRFGFSDLIMQLDNNAAFYSGFDDIIVDVLTLYQFSKKGLRNYLDKFENILEASPNNSEKYYIEIAEITSDLLAIYQLSIEKVAERFTRFHDLLFDFAMQHDERKMIFKAIDIKNPNYYE